MSENEINNQPLEENPIPVSEGNDQQPGIYPGSSDSHDEEETEGILTINWTQLIIGVAIVLWLVLADNALFDDWTFYVCLAIVVIIHELGHVVIGKSFGCFIKKMQVFFLTVVSYKPKQIPGGSSWRDITWSLGVLPFGGLTVFKSHGSEDQERDEWHYQGRESQEMGMTAASSPYIDDKPAWQRLLISAAGVLFNFATFLILYIIMPYIPLEWYSILSPLAKLSLLLAVLNILPIYPLDGGAIVFALFEIITGKKPSPAFSRLCGRIGFIIIILLFWIFPELLNGIVRKVFGAFF